ncbi:MAG TPA: hypothetical protein VHF69_14615 [Candidatus Synoicihabitans sp.]|nr:hypothetical protein [Candidatus Synoicihabitans sp.]
MNPRLERDALLHDVLAEGEPAAFQASLLESTLRRVRRRRRLIRARRIGGVALAATAVALVLLHRVEAPVGGEATEVPSHRVVRTEQLPPSVVVRTESLHPDRIISSTPFFAVVRTDPKFRARFIDDAELLALAGPGAAVLIRTGPHSQALIPVDGELPARMR